MVLVMRWVRLFTCLNAEVRCTAEMIMCRLAVIGPRPVRSPMYRLTMEDLRVLTLTLLLTIARVVLTLRPSRVLLVLPTVPCMLRVTWLRLLVIRPSLLPKTMCTLSVPYVRPS